MYIEVLNILKQEYFADKENDLWDNNGYIDFMNTVAGDIQDRIAVKIGLLNNK